MPRRTSSDNWEYGGARPAGEDLPQPRPRKRRLATTFAFTLLFFAGASIAAVAGDRYTRITHEDSATPADSTTTDATTTDTAPAAATPDAAPAAAAPAAPAADAAAPATAPAAGAAAPAAASEPDSADALQRSAPQTSAGRPSAQSSAQPSGSSSASAPAKSPAAKSRFHLGGRAPKRVVILPAARPAPAPEIEGPASGATVWLNSPLPDPTPPALRLSPAFAAQLKAAAQAAHVDWSLMLAILRAKGATGHTLADKSTLRRLAGRLASLSSGAKGEWAMAVAYDGSSTFGDKVVALARYDRAVGLGALVNGLENAKMSLGQRLLDDPAISIYAGGRDDIARGKVDVRVLAMIAYLHEAFGQVSVSCLITGHHLYARPGVISAHIFGRAVDIAALGDTSILGHQQPGGVTEQAVRDILLLPAEMMPKQVISLLGMGGPSFPLANHYNHIHIGF